MSSPLLLDLARRDLRGHELPTLEAMDTRSVVTASATPLNVHTLDLPRVGQTKKVYLEDLDLDVEPAGKRSTAATAWAAWLGARVSPSDPSVFARRFLVVDDETMAFFWETGTQVDTRVRIDGETRTVAKGALWAEESLPPESLLVGLTSADKSRREKKALTPQQVLDAALSQERTLQFGGKATVGRGLCRLIPTSAGGGR